MEPVAAMPPPKGIMANFNTFNPSIPQQPPQTGQTGLTSPRVPNQKQQRQMPGGLANTEVVPFETVDLPAGVRHLPFSKKPLGHFAVTVQPKPQQREQQSAKRGRSDKSDKKDGQDDLSLLDSAVETVAPPAPAMFNPVWLLERKLGQSRDKDREAREEIEKKMSGYNVFDALGAMLRSRRGLEETLEKNEVSPAERMKSVKVKNSVSQIIGSLARNRMGEIRTEFKKALEAAEVADTSLEPPRGLRRELRIFVGAQRDSAIETELSVAVMGRALQRHAPDCFMEMADVICSQMVGATLNQENLRKNPVRNRGAYAMAINDSKCFMQLRSTMSVARRLLVNLSEIPH